MARKIPVALTEGLDFAGVRVAKKDYGAMSTLQIQLVLNAFDLYLRKLLGGSDEQDWEGDLVEHKSGIVAAEEQMGESKSLFTALQDVRHATPATLEARFVVAERSLQTLKRDVEYDSAAQKEILRSLEERTFAYADFRPILVRSKHFTPILEESFYKKYFAENICDSLYSMVNAALPDHYETWQSFFDQTQDTLQRGGAIAALRYVNDVTAYWDEHIVGRPRYKIPTSRLLDHKELSYAMQQKEKDRQRYIALGQLPEQDVVWEMYDSFASTLTEEEIDNVVSKLMAMPQSVSLSGLYSIIRRLGPEDGFGFLPAVSREPRLLPIMDATLRMGVPKSTVVSFAAKGLYGREIATETGVVPLLNFLYTLKDTRQKNLLGIVITYADKILSSSYQAALLSIAQKHTEADVLIRDIVGYEASGASEKARITVYFGTQETLRGQELSRLRKHLKTVADEDLIGYTPLTPIRLLKEKQPAAKSHEYSGAAQAQRGQGKQHEKDKDAAQHQSSWLEHVAQQLSDTPEALQKLRTVYDACLTQEVVPKFRYLL